MTTKQRLKGYMEEEGVLESSKLKDTVEASGITTEREETKKPVASRGRPKSKPASKAMIFHLPLDLIAQIDAEADRVTTSNKSAFAVKVFSEYFAARYEDNTKE